MSEESWKSCVHVCESCQKEFEHRLNAGDPCCETSYCNDCRPTWTVQTLAQRWSHTLMSLRRGYRRGPKPSLDQYDHHKQD